MGQKSPVQVFVLVTEDTIEENLLGTLAAKQKLSTAVLDHDSTISEVTLKSNVEELRARLEVLLGTKPDAPIDQSELRKREEEAARLAQRDRLSAAGGQLVSAAFAFLGEMVASARPASASTEATALIRSRLQECVETDAEGRARFTVALPDALALDGLAEALSRLLGPAGMG